ncbi:ABC transporter ATP-binding protein [bacterium]|nr:ABC transporter ATP-binding protein [bacterium]
MASKHLVRLAHVSKDFTVGKNDVGVLKDVSLHIYPAEFTLLYGPSGSGKSTLLNTIIGLEPPTKGQVFVDGRDIAKLGEDARSDYRNRTVGVVYQQPHWVKTLNVIENVTLPLLIQGRSKNYSFARAEYSLQQVGMLEFAKRMPPQLSGGQQQKVGVARALVTEPELIVADEPTGNLDSQSSDEIMSILVELVKGYKRSVVMVTHELRFLKLADRAFSILDGELEQEYDKAALSKFLENYKEPLDILRKGNDET